MRLHYDARRLHAELTVAQEMGNISTEPAENDPAADNVLRLLGNIAWRWTKDHRLDGFFLYQNDHSSRQPVGQLVKEDREDPSDAALLWLGARASGELDLNHFGDMAYWLDGAWVGGHERLLDFKNCVLFCRKHPERKISIVTICTRIGHVTAEHGLLFQSFAAEILP